MILSNKYGLCFVNGLNQIKLFMLTKNRIPILIALICCLEILIYFWATCTTDADFVINKCARNAGRASETLNLFILIMVGYFGLKQIYADDTKKDAFRILITLFAVNHLIHFFFVYQNFKTHAMNLDISDNKHGFVTFICIAVITIALWRFTKLNKVLYSCIILHLFNVSYFIIDTLYHKIKPDIITFHYKFGIFITSSALIYILYRIICENIKTVNSVKGNDYNAS